MIRVGHGFDAHRWSTEGQLVLGGVAWTDHPALDGHSDADVVSHACADSLLAAAGLGDIGVHFPDTDERWSAADSIVLLAEVARLVRAAGWEPQNVDCTVVLDAPKIGPVREAMQAELSTAVGAPVTVKGKRTEGLGALGRGEGVVAWAVALVARQASSGRASSRPDRVAVADPRPGSRRRAGRGPPGRTGAAARGPPQGPRGARRTGRRRPPRRPARRHRRARRRPAGRGAAGEPLQARGHCREPTRRRASSPSRRRYPRPISTTSSSPTRASRRRSWWSSTASPTPATSARSFARPSAPAPPGSCCPATGRCT